MPPEPWDVYVKELFPVGLGHPLWRPKSGSTHAREVFLGDVGWLKEGQFYPCFNSMQDAAHPVNQALHVPRDFQVFCPPNLSIGKTDRITQQMVFSRSITASEVQADAVHDGAHGVGPTWRIHIGSDAGALAMLGAPGVTEDIQSRRRIVNYMVDNLDSWLESANTSHLGLHTEDMIFICGTLKTAQWASAAFQDDSFRNKDGYVSGQLDSFGNVELAIQISNQVLPASHCRTGPHRLPHPGGTTPASVSPGPDQCLFVHYYKGKRRLWQDPRQAPPGPHQLSSGSEARVCADAYDPVNQLLDFILQNSEANVAIASDLDLVWLFRDMEFPDDVPDALMRLSPSIELDERGVGTISVEFIQKRKDRDEEAIDCELAHKDKRARYHQDLFSSDWTPACSSFAGSSYRTMGDPAYYDQAPQGPQEMQYQQQHDMRYQPETLYQQGVPYQQTQDCAHGMDYSPYPPEYTSAHVPQHTTMPTRHDQIPTYVRPGMPWGIQPTPHDLSYPPHNAAYPSEFPVHGGTNHPRDGDDDANGSSDDDDNDNYGHSDDAISIDNATSIDDDTDGDDEGDDDTDEEMAEPSEKAFGKRPGWGAPTTVHDGSVSALAYSADGKYAASGSEDETIIIWDAPSNSARHKVPQQGDTGHTDTVCALAFSRDNVYLASASYDDEVVIWAVANGREHLRISPGQAICSLAYTPDGKYLVGGAGDGTLYLWDAQTYEEVRTLNKNTAVATFIIFSSDGQLMATGGTESVCYVWETASLLGGKPLSVLEGHRGMVCAAAFSPDSQRIVTASDDSSIRIWNAYTGEATVMLYEHAGPVWTVAFSPDGRRVASGSSDSTVKVCDSYTGERVLSLEGHEQDGMVNAVEFSPDGRYVASAASDNTVRLWRASDGAHQTTYNEHNDNVTLVMFAPDSSTLASGSHDGTALIRSLVAA